MHSKVGKKKPNLQQKKKEKLEIIKNVESEEGDNEEENMNENNKNKKERNNNSGNNSVHNGMEKEKGGGTVESNPVTFVQFPLLKDPPPSNAFWIPSFHSGRVCVISNICVYICVC
jgi:hypothetical protein